MKIFTAGGLGVEFDHELLTGEVYNRLLSYHYMNDVMEREYFYNRRSNYSTIILDSGAFSAWNSGVEIDLDTYLGFCLKNLDGIDHVVNLDVIPASPGEKTPTYEEVEEAAQAGYMNYRYMVDGGIPKEKMIHVFHQNEDFKWLRKLVDELPYIGLSPANDRTTYEKILWLDECMKYVTDGAGRPCVKFHGFAVTSMDIMKRYPWYSVDSSTPLVQAGRGVIFVPLKKDGNWNYSERALHIHVSSVIPSKNHFEFLSPQLQGYLLEYLEFMGLKYGKSSFRQEKKGYKLADNEKRCQPVYVRNLKLPPPDEGKFWVEVVEEDGVCNNWRLRQYLNIHYHNRFADSIPEDVRYNRDKTTEGFGF